MKQYARPDIPLLDPFWSWLTARVGIWEESRWERPGSRRGGVERGGDACIAPGGSTLPGWGDASIPTPLHIAPTRSDASEDAAHGIHTKPTRASLSPPQGDRKGPRPAPHHPRPYYDTLGG